MMSILVIFYVLSCTTAQQTSPTTNDTDYPRLAMWWPNSELQALDDLARYDWIAWGEWDDVDRIADLRLQNPAQLQFMSATLTETAWSQWDPHADIFRPEMREIPSEWFLTQRGSTLSQSVGSLETTLFLHQVEDENGEPLFEIGDTVTCGHESMLVIDVDRNNQSLLVERGFVRSASPHTADARIAAHITFWPNSWVMNLSAASPTYETPDGAQTWVDFSLLHLLPANDWDGYVIDRLESDQSWLIPGYARSIDHTASNQANHAGYESFDRAWNEGIVQLLHRVRTEVYQDKPILINSSGAYRAWTNGSIYEGVPGNWQPDVDVSYAEWEEAIVGPDGYLNSTRRIGFDPHFSLIETYEDEGSPVDDLGYDNPFERPGFLPNYRKMRFGLTTALLSDGYFSYEINTNGHGSLGLMWFDEYDNAGMERGYLGQPIADAHITATVGNQSAWTRPFEHGQVFVNPTDHTLSLHLDVPLQHIAGIQAPEINTGQRTQTVTLAPKDGVILLNPTTEP